MEQNKESEAEKLVKSIINSISNMSASSRLTSVYESYIPKQLEDQVLTRVLSYVTETSIPSDTNESDDISSEISKLMLEGPLDYEKSARANRILIHLLKTNWLSPNAKVYGESLCAVAFKYNNTTVIDAIFNHPEFHPTNIMIDDIDMYLTPLIEQRNKLYERVLTPLLKRKIKFI